MEESTQLPGARARRPRRIPLKGWGQAVKRTVKQVSEHQTSIVAAGLAWYAMFALFPALVAIVSIWGLVLDPAALEQQLDTWIQALPPEAAGILTDQLGDIAATAGGALGVAAAVAIVVALYSASRGVLALIIALNNAYEEREKRGFLKLNLVALGLTLGVILFVLLALGLVAVAPAIFGIVGLEGVGRDLVQVGRWPLLLLVMMGFLGVIYRYGPSRATPRWQWASPGAILATVLWLVASALFAVYVDRFADFNETYGALGAVMVLLLWLYLSGYAILIGAELNAQLESQTLEDSTTGPDAPMGERGAYVADHEVEA